MIFLFPRWDMLIPWRVFLFVFALSVSLCRPPLCRTRHENSRRWSTSGCPPPWRPCAVWRWCALVKKTSFSRFGKDSHSLEVENHHFSYVGLKGPPLFFNQSRFDIILKRKHHFDIGGWLAGQFFQIRCLGKMNNTWRVWRCIIYIIYASLIFCSKTLRMSQHTHHIIPQKFTDNIL